MTGADTRYTQVTEAATSPLAESRVIARWEEQIKASILWHRAAGLGERCTVGCPYNPERSEPDDRVYIATVNSAGEVEVTLEPADAFYAERLAAERLAAERRRAAQRDARGS